MVKFLKIVLALILLAGTGFLIYSYYISDEKKVIRRLERLAELVRKGGEEPAILMAQKMRGVGDLFAETCLISSDARSMSRTFRSEEIASHTASARAGFLKLSVKFYDIHVTFPENGVARVSLTAVLSGLTKSDERFDETHELEVELVNVQKEWFIRQIRAVEVLKK